MRGGRGVEVSREARHRSELPVEGAVLEGGLQVIQRLKMPSLMHEALLDCASYFCDPGLDRDVRYKHVQLPDRPLK